MSGDGGRKLEYEDLRHLVEKMNRERPVLLRAVVALVLFLILFSALNLYIAPTKSQEKKDLVLAAAQIVGGTALLAGLYFTWRTLELNREGQVTERFSRAIDQLGQTGPDNKPLLEVRMGGIFALERIARESPKDHWPIMQVLTAYIRENAPWPTKEDPDPPEQTPTDIQATLDVLKNRARHYRSRDTGTNYSDDPDNPEIHRLHLAKTDLRRAYLKRTRLEGASLRGADLREADFEEARLEEAWFDGANLEGANFERASLRGAKFSALKPKFGAASLRGAKFRRADLEGADLRGVDLSGAEGLTEEQLGRARTDW